METIEGIAKKYTLFPCSKVFSLGLLKGHGNLVHPAELVFIRQPEYAFRFFNKPLLPLFRIEMKKMLTKKSQSGCSVKCFF